MADDGFPDTINTSTPGPIPPSSTDEWLRVLTRKMDLRRQGVLMLRSYMDGNAPLPEMSKQTRQSWASFQRRARTNWGELIVDSVVDRLIPHGVTVNGQVDGEKPKQAQAIWRQNRMAGVFKSWVRYGMAFGQSYLTVWDGDSGWPGSASSSMPIITADSPETMIVVTDPLQHWVVRAAMRVWRNQEMCQDFAIVWTEDGWQQYTRPTYTRIELKVIPSKWLVNLAEGAWTTDGQPGGQSPIKGLAPIPVVVYNNPGGHGDYETHLDLINRINGEILERLVIQAMQAFRQRAITGGQLPERDEAGNVIHYEDVFSPAPGALWNLPEGLEIWQSDQTDLTGILNAAKEDIRLLAAMTRTPLPMLMPDTANQSAEGAKAVESGHLFRCTDRLHEAKHGVEAAMLLAMNVAGAALDPNKDVVEIDFADVQLITLTEKYTAALAAHNAGESTRSIQRNILKYSPAQIQQNEVDLAHEAMLQAQLPPIPTVVNERIMATPSGDDQSQLAQDGQIPAPGSPSTPQKTTQQVNSTPSQSGKPAGSPPSAAPKAPAAKPKLPST